MSEKTPTALDREQMQGLVSNARPVPRQPSIRPSDHLTVLPRYIARVCECKAAMRGFPRFPRKVGTH